MVYDVSSPRAVSFTTWSSQISEIFSEFPVQAYVTLEHAELKDCVFSWWISTQKYTALDKYSEDDIQKVNCITYLRIEGESSNVFYPSKEHVGRKLMVSTMLTSSSYR